jgi:hypothetical protein
MVNYVKTITEYIETGMYNYNDLEDRLYLLFAKGKLSQEELDTLLTLAGENARDSEQIDVVAKLKELEDSENFKPNEKIKKNIFDKFKTFFD